MKALSDTLHSVSLGPSMSLQMPHFHFFSWLSNVPLQALVTSLSVHLSMDIKVLPCPVVHSAVINIRVHISFRINIFISFGCISRSGTTRSYDQFSSVQSLSRVWLFVTPWIATCQAYLSITISQSSHKLMSTESVMPSWISSSVIPFSSCPQTLPASESFPMSQLFTWGGQSIEVSV